MKKDRSRALQRALERAKVHLIDTEKRGVRQWTDEARTDVVALEELLADEDTGK